MYICYSLLFCMNKAKTIGMITAIVAIAAFAAMAIAPTPIAHAQALVPTPQPQQGNTNGNVCTAGDDNEFCAFNANQDNEDSFHNIEF